MDDLTKPENNPAGAESVLNGGFGVWIPIIDSLPESGKPVLVVCGKKVLRAAHAAKFALDEENWGWWSDGEGADYNEANDTTYWPEGWYEWNEHEECHWALENEPTHWMPLPEAPNAKLRALINALVSVYSELKILWGRPEFMKYPYPPAMDRLSNVITALKEEARL